MIVRIYRLRWSIVRENSQQIPGCDQNPRILITICWIVIKTQELRSQFPHCHQNLKIVITQFADCDQTPTLSSQFADCDHNPKNYGHNFQVVIKISGFAIPIPRLGTKSQNCDHKSRIAINIPELRSHSKMVAENLQCSE